MNLRTKRATGMILVVAVLIALSWWLAQSSAPEAAQQGPPEAGSEHHRADDMEKSALAAASPAERVAGTSAVADPAAPSDFDQILVVDRATKAPVEGARVRWAHTSVTGPIHDPARPLFHADLEALLAAVKPALTNAHGIVRVAEKINPCIVCARRGELYADAVVYNARSEPIRIEIDRDLAFRIQVVDERETPVAGVPVGVRCSSAKPQDGDAFTAETEGDQGIARVTHLQKHLAMYKEPWSVAVHVATLGYESALVPVDLEHLPEAPVKIVIGTSGTIVVTVHDEHGAPVLPLALNLASTADVQKNGDLAWSARTFAPNRIEEGRAVFPFVPLGLDVYVDASVSGGSAHAMGEGPHFAGETVTFDLDMGPAKPVIVGRLVDGLSRPVAGCDAQMQIDARNAKGAMGTSSMPIRTDKDGRFRIPLFLSAGDELSGTLAIRPFCEGHSEGGEARMTLDARIHEGVSDIGDFVVHEPQVVAKGRVVDDVGVPVPNAMIGGDELVNVNGSERWKNISQLGGHGDERGEFTIKSLPLTGRCRLRAARQGFFSTAPSEFVPGQTDIVLQLTRASRIEGKALLDDAGQSATLWAKVVRTDITLEQRASTMAVDRVRLRADGSFELSAVHPGRADLAFELEGRKEPLLVVSGLILRAGETAADSRLSAIDLRGLIDAPAKPAQSAPR
jgi:hypothetical protein